MSNLYNEIDEIYAQPILDAPNGDYMCPVCKRTYKDKQRVVEHMAHRDCHSYSQIFKGTRVETQIFKIHKEISEFKGLRGYTLANFRKTGMYTVLAKLYVFCTNNKLVFREYVDYLISTAPKKMGAAKALHLGLLESTLNEFMRVRRFCRESELCDQFFMRNETRLKKDPARMLRAIERGDISVDYFVEHVDVDAFESQLSEPQVDFLVSLLNEKG